MRSDFWWLQLRTNLTYGERVTANRSDSMGDGHTYAREGDERVSVSPASEQTRADMARVCDVPLR